MKSSGVEVVMYEERNLDETEISQIFTVLNVFLVFLFSTLAKDSRFFSSVVGVTNC